jgi:acyl transferase domain-containing protein
MKSTAADGVVTYRTKLSGKPYGLLKDHQVSGQVIVPGAAYLEAAAAAARDLRRRKRGGADDEVVVVRDVLFEAPLIINGEEEEAHLQCVVLPDGTYEMQKTVGEEHEAVVVNGRGQLELLHASEKPVMREAVADVRARCLDEVDAVKMYEILRELGLEFGPRFRTIQRAYRGDKEALGELQVAPESEGWESKFHVHPAVLDGALQLVAVATSGGASNGTSQSDPYLPYSVRRMVVYKTTSGRMWGHARVTAHDKKAITCEVELTDENGQVIASLQDVTCRRMSRSASQQPHRLSSSPSPPDLVGERDPHKMIPRSPS